jgi:hypothetical protein
LCGSIKAGAFGWVGRRIHCCCCSNNFDFSFYSFPSKAREPAFSDKGN